MVGGQEMIDMINNHDENNGNIVELIQKLVTFTTNASQEEQDRLRIHMAYNLQFREKLERIQAKFAMQLEMIQATIKGLEQYLEKQTT